MNFLSAGLHSVTRHLGACSVGSLQRSITNLVWLHDCSVHPSEAARCVVYLYITAWPCRGPVSEREFLIGFCGFQDEEEEGDGSTEKKDPTHHSELDPRTMKVTRTHHTTYLHMSTELILREGKVLTHPLVPTERFNLKQ